MDGIQRGLQHRLSMTILWLSRQLSATYHSKNVDGAAVACWIQVGRCCDGLTKYCRDVVHDLQTAVHSSMDTGVTGQAPVHVHNPSVEASAPIRTRHGRMKVEEYYLR